MNKTTPVSCTITVNLDDISVLPKIKSTLKCFKGVVSVSTSSRHRSAASRKTLQAIREIENGDFKQFNSFDEFVAAK